MTCLKMFSTVLIILFLMTTQVTIGQNTKIGLNYPKTDPGTVQGFDQWREATIAVEEINAAGEICQQKGVAFLNS